MEHLQIKTSQLLLVTQNAFRIRQSFLCMIPLRHLLLNSLMVFISFNSVPIFQTALSFSSLGDWLHLAQAIPLETTPYLSLPVTILSWSSSLITDQSSSFLFFPVFNVGSPKYFGFPPLLFCIYNSLSS